MNRPRVAQFVAGLALALIGLAPAVLAGQITDKPGPGTVPVYRPMHLPFDGGEKAVYLASWNGMLSVATAAIYTTPQIIEGKKFYNVRVEAKSSRLLDFIWKMATRLPRPSKLKIWRRRSLPSASGKIAK